MKVILSIPLILLFHIQLIAQVTISNMPTTSMIFDPICQSWRPTGSGANLNITDLINDLMIMDVKIEDFDCSNPVLTCSGPIIVEETIVYASSNKLTLNSCTNVLLYASIINDFDGDVHLAAGSLSGTTSDGYVVVGTGIESINGLSVSFGPYSSNGLPLPTTRNSVFLSTFGNINIQAAKLLAVVSDTLDGQFAQLGSPTSGSQGSITTFSGQSYAVISRKGIGSYAKIGHGSNYNVPAINNASIEMFNEDGNLWLYSGDDNENQATIGHASQSTDILNSNISITIYDGGNNTDGNIEIKGGQANSAIIGHLEYNDFSQRISGNIKVQTEGTINILGGDQLQGYAAIGSNNPAVNNVISTEILVESLKGTSLYGGTNHAKAQIGNIGHLIDSPNSSLIIGSKMDISLFGGPQSEAFIGHQIEDLSGQNNGGDITVQAKSVFLISHNGTDGWTGIGHFDPLALSSLDGDILVTTNDLLSLKSGGMSSIAQIGHNSASILGKVDIFSGGDVNIESGSSSNADAIVIAEDSIKIYALDIVKFDAKDGDVLVKSISNKIDIAAQNSISQLQILGSTPLSMFIPNPSKSLELKASEDIYLVQEAVAAQRVYISTDHFFAAGELWPVISYMGDPFFLFGFTPLGGMASPLKSDDSYGMLLMEALSTFTPAGEEFELYTSGYNKVDGLDSDLTIGLNKMINLNGISKSIIIGDIIPATSMGMAIKQSSKTVSVENSTWVVDSIFIKSGIDLSITNSNLTTNDAMTIIADNLAPATPLVGIGTLPILQSTLNSGLEGIHLYSRSFVADTTAGGFTGSTFNGAVHSSCGTPCSTEIWPEYYPSSNQPNANSYLHNYKLPATVLALNDLNFNLECQKLLLRLTIDDYQILDYESIQIELSDNGKYWKSFGKWLDITQPFTIQKSAIGNNNYMRLSENNLNNEKKHSPIYNINCQSKMDFSVYPQPTNTLLYIQNTENNGLNSTYNLYSIYGAKVLQSTMPMDVSNLNPGCYMLVGNDLNKAIKVIISE